MAFTQVMRKYESLYARPLPARGNIPLREPSDNSSAADKRINKKSSHSILKGYLAPTIATKTRHSLGAVERYIRDFSRRDGFARSGAPALLQA